MTVPPNGSELEREVFGLCDQLLDGVLQPEAKARLDALVVGDAEARRSYVEYMQLSATIRQQSAGLGGVSLDGVLREFSEASPAPKRAVHWFWKIAAVFVLGAGIAGAVWVDWENAYVATLVEASGARWENTGFATEVGTRAGRGRVRLAEGLAKFTFRSGVELTLEGPAEFELTGRDCCKLVSGALVAHVPPSGKGFTVETRYATLIDLGTEFGIRTDQSGLASIHVLSGSVELRHGAGGAPMRLTTGQMAVVNSRELARLDRSEGESVHPSSIGDGSDRVRDFTHEITTRNGRGSAAYVSSPGTKIHFSETLLLLKNARTPHFLRKALLRFDLSAIGSQSLESARLTLNFDRTGFGFASLNQDAEFAVYGVTDDAQDGWVPSEVSWETLPAYSVDAGGVDTTKAVKLGRFVMPRGVLRGAYYIEGKNLSRYLQEDGNRLVTLVVVCENEQTAPDSVVFGFAGNNHPTLPPPTLRIRTTQ